jgi:hypothetical protein
VPTTLSGTPVFGSAERTRTRWRTSVHAGPQSSRGQFDVCRTRPVWAPGDTKRAALARCSTRAAAWCPLPDPWRRVRDPSWIRSPRRRSVSSLRRAVSVPCCARFADDPLDPFPQLDGCRCIEPPDGFDRDQLLRERPSELGRGRHPPQQRFATLRWKRSVGKGGQVTGGSAPHRSTPGRIASSVGARGWGLSLMRAMSRTSAVRSPGVQRFTDAPAGVGRGALFRR